VYCALLRIALRSVRQRYTLQGSDDSNGNSPHFTFKPRIVKEKRFGVSKCTRALLRCTLPFIQPNTLHSLKRQLFGINHYVLFFKVNRFYQVRYVYPASRNFVHCRRGIYGRYDKFHISPFMSNIVVIYDF
jgi:hypothetical protein